VPILAAHFMDELARQSGSRHVLAPEAVELLMVGEWPGNVRQLATLLQHAASLATGPVISAELVQRALGTGTAPQVSTFDEARDEFMRNYLVQLLQITRGNVTQAAKLAGRNRTDFYKLLARHGLQSEEFKIR
jgi:two-component system response regulator GlrR